MITVACVRTGTKFSPAYLEKLAAGVRRHLAGEVDLLCLTDRPDEVPAGMRAWDISALGLSAWWGKMALFSREMPARFERILYFDLDMIVTGDLAPLAAYAGAFGICANFTRRAGFSYWPCRYGSCVMSFPRGALDDRIWRPFLARREALIEEAGKYGDQFTIQELYPDADLLQDVMPPRYFAHFKRDLDSRRRPGPETSVLVFGGPPRPHEVDVRWCKDLWEQAA